MSNGYEVVAFGEIFCVVRNNLHHSCQQETKIELAGPFNRGSTCEKLPKAVLDDVTWSGHLKQVIMVVKQVFLTREGACLCRSNKVWWKGPKYIAT